MSDLFGNHVVGFPTRRLIQCMNPCIEPYQCELNDNAGAKWSDRKCIVGRVERIMGDRNDTSLYMIKLTIQYIYNK